eukprot:UN30558
MLSISDLTDEQIKEQLRTRSLPTNGNREELITRLRLYVLTHPRQGSALIQNNINTHISGDDWPYVVGGNVSHCVSDTKLSEGTLYWDIAFPIIFMATDDTKLVSTEFQVGGKRWKAEFWPKGGEVDDTGIGTFVYSKMGLTLMGPSEPIKVFSYFYCKNSRGEWSLPRRCRKPDLYSTDRNRWVYMKWVRYSQLKEYEWQNKLMLRIEVRLYGDSETTHDENISTSSVNHVKNSTLVKNMKHLCDNPVFSDIILKVEKEKFHAHRAILATQSPVFKAMFNTDMKEKESGVVEIRDTNPEIFKHFLEYIYTSQLSVDNISVGDLVILADKYQVESLTVQCLRYLCSTLTVDNVVEVFCWLINTVGLKSPANY